MSSPSSHQTELQAILDAAVTTAKAAPAAANISAVEKARKALDDYNSAQAGDPAGEKFKTQAAALQYLQRTWKIEKSKLSKDVQDGKVPRKDGVFSARDLDYYANACRLEPKNSEPQQNSDGLADDIKRETARKLRIQNEEREGLLINKAEEEARDARLWQLVKNDMHNMVPVLVHELMNMALPIISNDEERQRLLAKSSDLRICGEDIVDDTFDRYAKDGGIEA